ncbi:MAG TPA: hypothetical protein VEY30_08175 [Myxococcaceae bacterium]|nr:hypothetical protein [Myxococcaceae bacterium]
MRYLGRSALLLLLASGAASAGERAYLVRSVEDPNVPPDPSVCASAPFRTNVVLNASLYTTFTRILRDGKVVDDDVKKVGTAYACGEITNLAFPSGTQQNFYAKFNLPSGSFTGVGTCTLVSNDVPVGGLVLAGCNLKIIGAPEGLVGGIISSASVLNPFQLPGFTTGSYWTIFAYDQGSATPAP